MSDSSHTFATVISCMDGRIQEPLRRFAVSHFDVDFVDVVTDRGGILRNWSEGNSGLVENFFQDIMVSLQLHKSRGIIVAGHQECAGYPVPDDKKKEEVLEVSKLIKERVGEAKVVPVFVFESNGKWQAEIL